MTKSSLAFSVLILSFIAVPHLSSASGIEVMTGGKVVRNNATWFIPLNSSYNKIALFSEQREGFSIYNKTESPLTINSITLIKNPGVVDEEYTLQNTELKPGPLNFKSTTIQPGKRVEFYIRFYPVQSKELGATVKINYADSKQMTFFVKGKGRDKAVFTKHFKTKTHKLFGGQKTDEMVTGMVADKTGNIYFTGHVTGVKDKFAYDLFYGKIRSDGTLAYAKLWYGPHRDYTRDPGQNGESGGSAGAIAIDEKGYIYITGSVSPASFNNNFSALILKIDPKTGNCLWEKLWRPEWPGSFLAKHSAEAYGIDVDKKGVYITGTTGAAIANSDALVFALGLDKKDGSVKFQKYIDPTPKTNDRGYCIKSDKKGNLYIGGLAAKVSLLIKLKNIYSNEPKTEWVKTIQTGWGSNINSIDIDEEGSIYTSVDRRGAKTEFSFLKLNASSNLTWGKTYTGGSNKNNNCSFIKVDGNDIYVGGRTGQSWYDAQMGDGKLIKVNALDGKERWSAFYFTGKGPDELGEHRLKGIAVSENRLYLIGQVYTGSLNGDRYWGYWYNGVSKLADYKPQIKDSGLDENSAVTITKGAVKDAASARTLVDINSIIPWQDASSKHDGHGPDADLIFWQLEL